MSDTEIHVPIGAALVEWYGINSDETCRVYKYRDKKYLYLQDKKNHKTFHFESLAPDVREIYEGFKKRSAHLEIQRKKWWVNRI